MKMTMTMKMAIVDLLTYRTSCSHKYDGELDYLQHGDEQGLRDGVLLCLAVVPHAVVAHLLPEVAEDQHANQGHLIRA